MTQSLNERMTRDRARPALRVGGGVAIVLVAQLVVSTVVSVVSYLGYGAVGSPTGAWDLQTLVSPFLGFGYSLFGQILPFSIGVLIAVWLLVPLATHDGLVRVALRSVAASAVGAGLAFVVMAVYGGGSVLQSAGPWFGGSLPRFDGDSVLLAITSALQNGIMQFVVNTPVVVMVGILVTFLATLGRREASSSVDG